MICTGSCLSLDCGILITSKTWIVDAFLLTGPVLLLVGLDNWDNSAFQMLYSSEIYNAECFYNYHNLCIYYFRLKAYTSALNAHSVFKWFWEVHFFWLFHFWNKIKLSLITNVLFRDWWIQANINLQEKWTLLAETEGVLHSVTLNEIKFKIQFWFQLISVRCTYSITFK
jgi:hypothetical protein